MITTREEALQEIARLRAVVTGALWGRLPEASVDFDRTRLDVQIFEEVLRVRKLVLQSVMAAVRPAVTKEAAARETPAPVAQTKATPPRSTGPRAQNGTASKRQPSAAAAVAVAETASPAATTAATATATADDPAMRVLEGLQLFVLQHPVAAQKLFASLVAEGRRYAETEEGARWASRLGGSPVIRRARQLWESSLASVLDDGGETILPSEYVEILLQGAKLVAPEELGARISDKLSPGARP